MSHPIPQPCIGGPCALCDQPATHKIAEMVPDHDPYPDRHPLTHYVCCRCFGRLFGYRVAVEFAGCPPLDPSSIIGQWPGYESDEEVQRALKEMS